MCTNVNLWPLQLWHFEKFNSNISYWSLCPCYSVKTLNSGIIRDYLLVENSSNGNKGRCLIILSNEGTDAEIKKKKCYSWKQMFFTLTPPWNCLFPFIWNLLFPRFVLGFFCEAGWKSYFDFVTPIVAYHSQMHSSIVHVPFPHLLDYKIYISASASDNIPLTDTSVITNL